MEDDDLFLGISKKLNSERNQKEQAEFDYKKNTGEHIFSMFCCWCRGWNKKETSTEDFKEFLTTEAITITQAQKIHIFNNHFKKEKKDE